MSVRSNLVVRECGFQANGQGYCQKFQLKSILLTCFSLRSSSQTPNPELICLKHNLGVRGTLNFLLLIRAVKVIRDKKSEKLIRTKKSLRGYAT